jgi:hypothetical protein
MDQLFIGFAFCQETTVMIAVQLAPDDATVNRWIGEHRMVQGHAPLTGTRRPDER